MNSQFVLLLVASAATSFGQAPLAGADFNAHIAGPKADAAWFAGKVVLLEYFGVN